MNLFPYFLGPLVPAALALLTPAPDRPARVPATSAAAPDTVLVAGSRVPELISRQFKFTEGPAADRRGNVFFTDQPNDAIWRYGTDGRLTLFMQPAGRANGLYFDRRGNLLACADEHNQLWSISPAKKVTVLLQDLGGQHLNGPNDLWVRPQTGAIYFTDPYYQRDYWTRTKPEIEGQKVYYLANERAAPVVVEDQLTQPNGLIGTPDGRTLYVADIGANKTYRYHLAPDGRLTDKQLFVEQGSDGLTLDSRGNVYLTGHGVTVYNPAGQRIAHFAVPEKWTANVCFGGPDRKMLFITASEGVYKLPMRVRGSR